MKIKVIKTIIIISPIIILMIGWIACCGYLWSWGPFSKLHNIKTSKLEGNKMEIIVNQQETELTNKHILYLGSSVTEGAAAMQKSFVEYIAERNNNTYVKEAVSGTTLVDNGLDSYVSRLKKVDKNEHFDMFICQLSTNDATQKKPLGEITDSNYDTKTICGAIQYIVSYVNETYHCPIMFYTGSYYKSENYQAMVNALKEIANKMNIGVIDMYNNEEFNNISKEDYSLYMADAIHPTRAGYYYWWTPYMEEKMIEYLKK